MKKLILGFVIILSMIFLSAYADGITDYPPLPENGRTHYAIYTEASRDNRVELAMFNIDDDIINLDRILVWGNSLKLRDNTKYKDSLKYYLEDGAWVQFEQDYPKISDNVTELLYSDLSYVRVFVKPDSVDKMREVYPSDNGYYIVSMSNSNQSGVFFSKDLKDYEYIGSINGARAFGKCDGEYAFVSYSMDSIPMYAWEAGRSSYPVLVYSADGRLIKEYTPSNSIVSDVSYDWNDDSFIVTFMVITEAVPREGSIHNLAPLFYTDIYKTCDFENFEAVPNGRVEKFDDHIEELICNDKYKVISHKVYDGSSRFTSYTKRSYSFLCSDGTEYDIHYENGTYDEPNIYSVEKVAAVTVDRYSTDGIYFYSYPQAYIEQINKYWTEDNLLCVHCGNYIFKTPMKHENNTIVCLNNTILGFEQPPVTENDRTLVPMRFLLESMGAEISWDANTQTVTASLNDKTVKLQIDNITAQVNDNSVALDVPARLINGKTLVPLRFLSKNLGFAVEWDEQYNMAIIKL